ncbi:hypothetical protein [Streptomyces sp. NPDC008139]|uniref:hypothetical protein n=1 Tax=Streptomyces sp. NPDC008139 TaxID=3364814 RepID=UPI0036E19613
MTTTAGRSPRLKSLTTTPDQARPAEPAGAPAASGAPKAAAEGVLSAVGMGPRPADGRRPIAWLHIIAPSAREMPPRAVSRCECGRYLTARGRTRVLALIENHVEHRTVCPLHHTPEGRRTA